MGTLLQTRIMIVSGTNFNTINADSTGIKNFFIINYFILLFVPLGWNLFEETERVFLKEIPGRMTNIPVHIGAKTADLLSLAIEQNFLPVVDGIDIFIGIIRRREIIEYCASLIQEINGKS
ncbi:MAG: hypothetical protein C4554_07190 [Dethiobacter sp.]|jgi:hypothetical protein|nr:MAG: hypothetical protein C4554_07190 [Dethiobacter sp.]